jgi:tetratricopeptide (TPR) repeat protein
MNSLPDRAALGASLLAYAEGDLLGALRQYPHNRIPSSPEEKVFRASLCLIAGQVTKAEGLLSSLDRKITNRQAISTLIAAVTLKQKENASPPETASEWMAESYYRQSQGDLKGAHQAAEKAVTINSDFGLGWTRLAEVEFAQGEKSQVKEALKKGLALAPTNPAAHALQGSILSADGALDKAIASFEQAMSLDSALGDAWAGRGLCLIRKGQVKAGQRDLFTAAALEPNRAIFRKYFNDALGNANHTAATNKGRSSHSTAPDNSRQSSPRSNPTTGSSPNNANSEPIYQGHIPGAGTNNNSSGFPVIIFPAVGNSNPRPSGSGPTTHTGQGGDDSFTSGGVTHHRPTPPGHSEKGPTPHPAPSRSPKAGQPTHLPTPKRKPTPSESPSPN